MEKIKKWFCKPIFTLICYFLALLVFCYFVYVLNLSYQSLSTYVEAGSLSWTGNFGDIVSFIMTNTFSYLFYMVAFIFFGKVINIINPKELKKVEIEESEIVEEETL